jgi:hypothetical protein
MVNRSGLFTLGYLLDIHLKFSESKRPTYLEIGFFLLCIYYSPWKHTSLFIYSSWQVSLEHFSLSICDFKKTFFSTQVEATEVSILATSAWSFEMNGNSNGNWRYGKTREFRVKSNLAPENSRTFYPELVSCCKYILMCVFRENNIYREGISQFLER